MTEPQHPGPNELIRLDRVIALCGIKRSQVYAMIARGEFPKQMKVGRSSLWPLRDVDRWIDDRIAERDARFAA